MSNGINNLINNLSQIETALLTAAIEITTEGSFPGSGLTFNINVNQGHVVITLIFYPPNNPPNNPHISSYSTSLSELQQDDFHVEL